MRAGARELDYHSLAIAVRGSSRVNIADEASGKTAAYLNGRVIVDDVAVVSGPFRLRNGVIETVRIRQIDIISRNTNAHARQGAITMSACNRWKSRWRGRSRFGPYSTLLGGSNSDGFNLISVSGKSLYLGGYIGSADFPETTLPGIPGDTPAALVKIDLNSIGLP